MLITIIAENNQRYTGRSRLDLRKIPASPDLPPEQSIGFSSDTVPKGTVSSEKANILSLDSNPGVTEALRKSSTYFL